MTCISPSYGALHFTASCCMVQEGVRSFADVYDAAAHLMNAHFIPSCHKIQVMAHHKITTEYQIKKTAMLKL